MKKRNRLTSAVILLVVTSLSLADSVDRYIKDAENYLEKKDYKAAIIQLKNAAQQSPENAKARLKLGETYLVIGDGASAYKEFRKAKKYGSPRDAWVTGVADSLLLQGRGSDLLNEIKLETADSTELKSNIYARYGQAHLLLREITQAEESFSKSLKLAENFSSYIGFTKLYLAKGDKDSAKAQLQKALSINPSDAEALVLKADLLKVEKKIIEAKSIYELVVEKYPQYIPAIAGLAETQAISGDKMAARMSIEKGLAINENIPAFNYLSAALALEEGDEKKAESSLLKVFKVTENHLLSNILMGRIQYVQGNYQQAGKYLSQAYRVAPNNVQIVKILSAARLKANQPDAVIEIISNLGSVINEDAKALSLLGMAYAQKGNHSKSADYFEKAAEINPNAANYKAQLGMNYLAGGDLDGAIDSLQKAIAIDDDLKRADALLILAHLRKKEYNKALKAAQAYANKQPDSPAPHNFIGGAYLGMESLSEARKSFEKALAIDSRFVSAEINLAKLDVKEKKLGSANKRLRKVIEKSPDNIAAHILLAQIELQSGNKDESFKLVKQAHQQNTKALKPVIVLMRMYLANNQPQKALDLGESTRSDFASSTLFLDLLATTQLTLNKHNDAIANYEDIVVFSPNNPNVHFKLGQAYAKNKQQKKAVDAFEKATRLDENHLQANVALAQIAIVNKDYKRSKIIEKKLKKAYPKSSVAWVIEGDRYYKRKNFSKAVTSYESALDKNGNNKVMFKLAKTYRELKENDKAENVLKNWVVTHERDIAAYLALGQFYQSVENTAKAAEIYEKVLKITPNSLVALNNLAYIYAEQGNAKALKHAEKAYSLAPQNAGVIDTYGWSLVKVGDKAKGLNILKEAILKAPNVGDIRYHLAYAYNENGQSKEAKIELQYLLKTGVEFSEVEAAKTLLESL